MDSKVEEGYNEHVLSNTGIHIEPIHVRERKEQIASMKKEVEFLCKDFNKETKMITQSKSKSFIEALTNTFIGYITTLIVSPFIYWICNVEVTIGQMSSVTLLFTIVSILRNYIIRRWFNKLK